MACKYIIATLALITVTLATAAQAQNQGNQGMMSVPVPVPGARTALGLLASATDGMGRYLAPDGPIQPAQVAIGTLPVRGVNLINGGISRISSGLNNQAQRLWQSSGQTGPIRTPGLETAESFTPEVIASMGQQGRNLIRRKNSLIMDQANAGIKAAQQAGERMHNTLQQGTMAVRSSGPSSMNSVMETPAKLISSAHEFITNGASKLHKQAEEHLHGVMGRMGGMQDMGKGAMDQVQGITRTLQKGAQGVMGQFQQTGEELMSQLQRNHQKNMQTMSGGLGSLQSSMGKMGSNMQSNMDDVRQHAQKTVHELTEGFQKMAKEAADAPMKVLSSLGSMMGSMKGMSSSSGKGGRY